jgi:hypothetical protein
MSARLGLEVYLGCMGENKMSKYYLTSFYFVSSPMPRVYINISNKNLLKNKS